MLNATSWKETICKNEKIELDDIDELIKRFHEELKMNGEEFKTLNDGKSHFKNWYRKAGNQITTKKHSAVVQELLRRR